MAFLLCACSLRPPGDAFHGAPDPLLNATACVRGSRAYPPQNSGGQRVQDVIVVCRGFVGCRWRFPVREPGMITAVR